jgi:ornithine carbamoyltransferase
MLTANSGALMLNKSLIRTNQWSRSDVEWLLSRTLFHAKRGSSPRTLRKYRVGLLFERVSTRTRTAFSLASQALGAHTIEYRAEDLQLTTGETLEDTAAALAQYLDCLVVRTHAAATLQRLSTHLAVINALTEEEHPTQAIADLAAIVQHFGTLTGLRTAFVGAAGNIANSFCLALLKFAGAHVTMCCPAGYGFSSNVALELRELCGNSDSDFSQCHSLEDVSGNFDVIYTTRWKSMGQEKPSPNWRAEFQAFQVNTRLVDRLADSRTILLHDLPAERGGEITDDVLDGSRSRVLAQARNKLFSAMAILEFVLREQPLDGGHGR